MIYGGRPMSRHGQQASPNNAVLPLLPVDLSFEIPSPRTGTKQGSHQSGGSGPRPMPSDVPGRAPRLT
ncbi:hypothetical protein TNCV_1319211 [Trichonephila clavipes]|nr:hypothetical protein TNCV_1319211 [Trichonephila clavipes]